MKATPEIGQRLYLLNINNAARYSPKSLTPVKVVSVGRKYFKVATDDQWKIESEFHLDSWRQKTECSPDAALYESEQALADERECDDLRKQIREAFQYGRSPLLTLSALREIAKLIHDSHPRN